MNLCRLLIALSCLKYAYCDLSCETLKTCGECIGHAAERCMWCSQEAEMTHRCQPETHSDHNWCEKQFIINPQPIDPIIEKDIDFSSTVQFRPQKIKIKARPGVAKHITVHYKPADDFPLDVYFLMDFTLTMRDHRDALRSQTDEIFRGLRAMTGNVRMGLGSFIEKPALPYTDIQTPGQHYSFRNILKLTNNATEFQNAIKLDDSDFGSNYDDPEAGLDGLMQVMKCDELDWRRDARRIIVLATDNTYHSAGDGKMVGAIKPNDMRCHLEDNEYKSEFSLQYDYPSVSQINRVARDGNFKIIFAVMEKIKDVYELLSEQITGSVYAKFETNSKIFNIIETAYQELEKNVKIDYDDPSESFEVNIDQDCNKNGTQKNCQITPKNKILSVPVSLKSINCSKTTTIVIRPSGLQETLNITFEVDCQCDCEVNIIDRRSECNNAGNLQCGACKCDDQKGGNKCQFNCSDDDMALKMLCYQANSTTECNNHGKCICGSCECEGDYSGQYCEYSPDSCNKAPNGKICADRGPCRNGKCECRGPWIGDDCNCPIEEISLQQCTEPFSKKKCSGRGQCNCGICNCDKDEKNKKDYSGTFCESCDDCAAQRCNELKEYAKCNHNNTVEMCNKLFNLTSDVVDVILDKRSHLRQSTKWKSGTSCRTELDDGTLLLFKYVDPKKDTKLLLMIQKELEAPPEPELAIPIASAILGILLVGILTAVLWKVLINIYDKKEYDRFCKEAEGQGFDIQNPLYEPPTQNFVNPAFHENN